jgi:lactate permease
VENELPVTWGLWLAAFTPVLILLVLLAWLRWKTSAAAPIALAAAVFIALLLFQTDFFDLAVATGKGIWDAIFVLYVVWPALLLFMMSKQAGAFITIREGIRDVIPSRLMRVLAFAWVLCSFMQGVSGFGAPLAVTSPLLVGLGMQPIYAVSLAALGRAWNNELGSLGESWFATVAVVDIADQVETLRLIAALTWVPDLTAGLAIAWFYGGFWAVRRGLVGILIISLVHGGGQLLISPYAPAIGNFLATTAALLLLYPLGKWGPYSHEDDRQPQRVFGGGEDKEKGGENERAEGGEAGSKERRERRKEPEEEEEPPMSTWMALAPYIFLFVVALTVLLIPPVRSFLEQFQAGLPFPATETGYEIFREETEAYNAFAPFTHPGTVLLLSAFFGFFLYRAKGIYPEDVSAWTIVREAAREALPSTTAITALILVSQVMDTSGELPLLAMGIAEVAPRMVFLGLSDYIGILGAFVTSSNTASNILMAPLQVATAALEDLPKELIIALQSAGGAIGNAIAPGDLLVGATAVGIPQRLGAIIAKVLPWTLITGAITAAVGYVFYFMFYA